MLKQRHKIRVIDRIVNNEAGIDWNIVPADVRGDGIAMPTYIVVLFIDRDVVLPVQQPSTCQARDAGADDCYFLSVFR